MRRFSPPRVTRSLAVARSIDWFPRWPKPSGSYAPRHGGKSLGAWHSRAGTSTIPPRPPDLGEQLRRAPLELVQEANRRASHLLTLEIYTAGFLVIADLELGVARETAHAFTEYPEPITHALDNTGMQYQAWLRQSGGTSRNWRVVPQFTPALHLGAEELLLTIPQVRWHRVYHRHGRRQLAGTHPAGWHFAIGLAPIQQRPQRL